MRDEELAPVGSGSGVGHREHTGRVVSSDGAELIPEVVPGATHAGPGGVAALHHEVGDDPMKLQAVVVATYRQVDEVGHRHRRLRRKERDADFPFDRVEHGDEFVRSLTIAGHDCF